MTESIVYAILNLGLWLLILAMVEQFRLIGEIVGWRQTKPADKKRGRHKLAKKSRKATSAQQPSGAELAASVRQMFPEPPPPSEHSRARAGMVSLFKSSVRGLFDLLSEEVCVNILKKIAGAGSGCPRCGNPQTEKAKDPHYRQYYTRRHCRDCQSKGRTATFYELTGTIFEHSHLAARQWLWGMFLFVAGCSSREIAPELKVNLKTGQRLVALLQLTLITCRYRFRLTGHVEFDEAYVIGGLMSTIFTTSLSGLAISTTPSITPKASMLVAQSMSTPSKDCGPYCGTTSASTAACPNSTYRSM